MICKSENAIIMEIRNLLKSELLEFWYSQIFYILQTYLFLHMYGHLIIPCFSVILV